MNESNLKITHITAALARTIIHAAYVVPAWGWNPRFYSLHVLCGGPRELRDLRKPFDVEDFESRGRAVCGKCVKEFEAASPFLKEKSESTKGRG